MGRFLAAVVVLTCLVIAATAAWDKYGHHSARLMPDRCVAQANTHRTAITPEQARNSATIVSIAVTRGLPARAATIAIATAIQESQIYNLDYGDRDSLGLFQQRPSMGWGTEAQVQDPVYASNKFYDGLVKVRGYQEMEVTVAAQEVQRSGFPNAYADHESEGRAIASTLTGQTPAGFSCTFSSIDPGKPGTVAKKVKKAYGALAGDPVVAGRSVTIPVTKSTTGWSIAQWLVAYGKDLGLSSIKFDGQIWNGADGWKPTTSTDRQIVVTVKA